MYIISYNDCLYMKFILIVQHTNCHLAGNIKEMSHIDSLRLVFSQRLYSGGVPLCNRVKTTTPCHPPSCSICVHHLP